MRLQVNKEKFLQKEQAKIAKQLKRGREWMGGSVAGSYLQSLAPKSAPFFEDASLWNMEILKHQQNRNSEPSVKLEKMRTVDLVSLRRRTDEVEPNPNSTLAVLIS